MTPGQAAGLIVALSVIGLGLLASVAIIAIQECWCKRRTTTTTDDPELAFAIPIVRPRTGSWV